MVLEACARCSPVRGRAALKGRTELHRAKPRWTESCRVASRRAAPRPPVLYSAMLNLKRPSCAVHSYKAPCFSQKAAKDCMPNP